MAVSALFAGFVAGLLAALLHFALIEPILLQAEMYESGQLVHVGVVPGGQGGAAHDQAAMAQPATPAAPALAGPFESGPIEWRRHGLSVIFYGLLYSGYGLLLVAGFALAEIFGIRVAVRSGLIWGLAGFVAVVLAPAAGLPPELPGMAGGEVTLRQIWWVGTVVTTGAGLALLSFGRGAAIFGLATVLIAGPHVIGAPHPAVMTGPVPPELAALFAGRTLGAALAVWVVLGLLAATFWNRQRA